MHPLSFGLILLGALLTALGGIFLKRSAMALAGLNFEISSLLRIATNMNLIIGFALYFIPIVFWIYLLRFYDLSKIQPMLSIVYVFTAILSIFFLGETVGLLRWLGIGFIIFGVVLVSQT
jgi:drug/metabolite transporter (DMT)-like permease